MLRKFKLVALVSRFRNGKNCTAWTTYVAKAHDPFEARAKVLAKYPGRTFSKIAECWPNGNMRFDRTWTPKYLAEHEAEIKLEYDFELKS